MRQVVLQMKDHEDNGWSRTWIARHMETPDTPDDAWKMMAIFAFITVLLVSAWYATSTEEQARAVLRQEELRVEELKE